MTDFEIAAVGDNCIDWFVGTRAVAFAGGNAVNVGIQMSKLGRRVAYFGAVGRDAAGDVIAGELADNRVDLTFLHREDAITAYTIVEHSNGNDRRFVFEEFGATRDYRPRPDELVVLTKARHVHIGWLNDAGMTRRAMAEAGVSVSQDVSVNAEARNLDVEGLTVAFASASGPRAAAVDRAESLIAAGARLAVVTRGAAGSLASDGTRIAEIPARLVEAVDTTGAGDSFIAGFLDARLKGLPLEDCLLAGRETASACCLHMGGFPQRPADLDPAILSDALGRPVSR